MDSQVVSHASSSESGGDSEGGDGAGTEQLLMGEDGTESGVKIECKPLAPKIRTRGKRSAPETGVMMHSMIAASFAASPVPQSTSEH